MEAFLEEFLNARSTAILLLVTVAGIAVLVKGAGWLVDGAVGLSERLGIPKVIIGATVVSIGTTTPEAAVSVMAAFNGLSDFALGNSVGSIICDTGLIFGLSCLLARLPMDRFILNRHGWLQFGAGALLVTVSLLSLLFPHAAPWTGVIPRSVGFLFIGLLVAYILVSIYWAKTHTAAARLLEAEVEETEHHAGAAASVIANAVMLLIGLLMVLAASQVLINTVEILCLRWGVPSSIISATLIAFGTSLPELVTALTSIRRGHLDLVIGNIIGADILNVLFVTGAAACAAPLQVEPLFFRLHFPMMMAVLILFRLTVHFSKGTFARWPGVLFIGLHLSYVLLCLLFGAVAAH